MKVVTAVAVAGVVGFVVGAAVVLAEIGRLLESGELEGLAVGEP